MVANEKFKLGFWMEKLEVTISFTIRHHDQSGGEPVMGAVIQQQKGGYFGNGMRNYGSLRQQNVFANRIEQSF